MSPKGNIKLVNSFFLILVIILNIKFASLNAQPFKSSTFTAVNGLPHNYIQSIAQDKTGFLWIATYDGISRFDGYEFRSYYHRPGDSTTFSFFVVDKLLVDTLNNVWVFSSLKPLCRYNRANDNFCRFNLLENTSFSDITQSRNGYLWLVNDTSLYQYLPSKNQIKRIKMVSGSSSEPFYFDYKPQIVIDNLGKFWFFDYSDSSFKTYSGAFVNDSVLKINQLNDLDLSGSNTFRFKQQIGDFEICTTDSNKTWLFSKFGLFLFDTINKIFQSKENVTDLSGKIEKSSYSWVDDKTGIHVIYSKSAENILIPNQNDLFFETVLQDNLGNIWAGTVSENRTNIGLVMFRKMPGYFNHLLTGPNSNNELNLVFPILKDKFGNIWTGVRNLNYLIRINPDKTIEKINYLKFLPGNDNPKVRTMVQDSTGIWMGCTNNYILFYDFQTEKFSVLNNLPFKQNNEDAPLNIHNIAKVGDHLIFSGWEGVYSYSLKSGKIKVEYSYIIKGAIFCMTKDEKGGFWLGSNTSTIIHIDSEFNEIGKYKIGAEADVVEHICLGDNNDVWVAMMGGGLGHLDLTTGKTKIYTTADGLSNNTLYSIMKDKHGKLWISSNKGLSQFNPDTKTFRRFGEDEGLLIEEFNSDAFFQASDGEMFFGGIGGLVGLYPDSIYQTSAPDHKMPLVITDFKVSGIERRFDKPIYDMDTIWLSKGENNIQLTFALLDFENANKIKYRYRVAEESSYWTETSHRNRNVNYTNLSPGTYHFELECTDKNGEWSSSKMLVINIPFFFYQTVWFRTAMFFLVMALITLVTLVVIRQIRLRANQKQNDLKLESLRSQMNPHFIFNALNSINYFISNNDKVSANSYITDFSKLIRSVLNNLSHDFIPLEHEIESIQEYLRLEHLRFSDKFNYELEIEPPNLNRIHVYPGLLQPLIENAIWHGVRGLEKKKGLIVIRLEKVNGNKLKCIVEDNGIGRKQAYAYRNVFPGKKSRGIGIVEERLKIISEINKTRYNLVLEDVEPDKVDTGTRAIIDLPVRTG